VIKRARKASTETWKKSLLRAEGENQEESAKEEEVKYAGNR